jgi:broad specificity phosphatase PhoE
MRRVYLVRHAAPAVRPDTPSREWTLSDAGIAEAQALAVRAATWGLRAVYSGDEPKMRGTALILGEASQAQVQVHIVDAFNETRVGRWIANSDEFNELVRAVFQGDPLPRGVESGDEAAARFEGGLRIIEQGPFPAAVVSGGRVLTSYLARRRRGIEDAFAFWRGIPFPGWTSIDLDAPQAPVLEFVP